MKTPSYVQCQKCHDKRWFYRESNDHTLEIIREGWTHWPVFAEMGNDEQYWYSDSLVNRLLTTMKIYCPTCNPDSIPTIHAKIV